MGVHYRDLGSDIPLDPPDRSPTTEGPHIALMGIDGAGKSTIAAELADALRAAGHDVEIVNFKRAMADADPATASILSHVAYAALKTQYAEAVPADTPSDLTELLADSDIGAKFSEVEGRLRDLRVERNAARPVLSSAVLEIVGGFWVQAYVESRLRAGAVVINDSFGFKHALKNVLLAQRAAGPDSPLYAAAQSVLDTARSLFHALLRPTYGYWIDTDPRLALRWRATAGDITTAFENYGLVGETGDASFLAMQEDCRAAFREAAEEWNWQRVTMDDLPREENVGRAVRLMARDALRHRERARSVR